MGEMAVADYNDLGL